MTTEFVDDASGMGGGASGGSGGGSTMPGHPDSAEPDRASQPDNETLEAQEAHGGSMAPDLVDPEGNPRDTR